MDLQVQENLVLYNSILKYKNKEELIFQTVEDPIEYQIEGINQVQCKNRIRFKFCYNFKIFIEARS